MGNWCNIIKILKKKNYKMPVRKKTKSIIGLAGEEEKRKHLVEQKKSNGNNCNAKCLRVKYKI